MDGYLKHLAFSLEKVEIEEKAFCQCFILKSKDEVIMKEVHHEEEENQEIKCPLHKNLSSKENIQRSEDKLESRGIQSLPKCVRLRKSSTVGNEYGVWLNMEIPKGIRFGPYEGITVNEADQSGYSWKVLKEKNIYYSMDAKNEHGSNWLDCVNFACDQGQQNLVVFQYNRQIYYETIKDISPDTEVLAWCGDDDATIYGSETEYNNAVEIERCIYRFLIMDTVILFQLAKAKEGFPGVSSNCLPKSRGNNRSYIINLDPGSKPGSHYILRIKHAIIFAVVEGNQQVN